MSHDDFDFEPVRGLPANLPENEKLLWQGAPEWKALALRAYHVRKVVAYFSLLVAWRIGSGLVSGHDAGLFVSCLLLVTLGGIAIGVLTLLAYLNARSTVYSITSKRVILRHGVAVSLTLNVPFKLIDGADYKGFKDETGDIALRLPDRERIGYLITWPHLRTDKITRPQPSLRALADARQAAAILSAALAADAGAEGSQTSVITGVPAGARSPRTEPHAIGPQSNGPRTATA
jgi:hypothetical protein